MRPQERALARRQELARVPGDGAPDPAAGAEAALRAALDEVTRLDAEVEALSEDLAAFARRYERAVGAAFGDLALAERLVRRLQTLEEGLAALARGEAPAGARRRGRGRAGGGRAAEARAPAEEPAAPAAAACAPEPEVLPADVALKRLYRRLARLLHPDLAPAGAADARRSDLMARANDAYARGDLATLEVMAERLGAGEVPGELSPEERRAHLEARAAALARIGASLARERDRLLRSDTARLRAEALRDAAEGRDHLGETARAAAEEADAAYADALARLDRVFAAAAGVSRRRRAQGQQERGGEDMAGIARRGPTGARRAFDPLEETGVVRAGAARLERQRATPAARALARGLEARAGEAPFEVALALLAFFAEEAGARPPTSLEAPEGWSRCWERLRSRWPGAPDLPRLLARLPPHLCVGARAQGTAVVAGVQLADAALLAGVRIALERESVAAIAREVLRALGPEERCAACGADGPAIHLLRTRGLDEVHGLACAGCGAVLRSYWRYGEVDGLEALAPHALRLGVTAEVTAQLAGSAIGFQMLPAEREALTAGELRRRLHELYLVPCGIDLPRGAVGVARGPAPLGASARIGTEGRLRFTVEGEAAPEELLELLRARIERRFRP